MRVNHLSLRDFRNYQEAEVRFEPGHNLVIGRNGQGKTNLVEAIAYFASLRSHRVSSDTALIRAGAENAIARMRVAVSEREASLEIQFNRGASNHAQVNGNAVRPREITRWFSAVVFAPEDLMIVRGEPALRRRFLDDAMIARNPAMSSVLTDYERVVRQRTALLKSARASGARTTVESTLEIWDQQLVSLGSRITLERRRLVDDLRRPIVDAYSELVDADHAPNIDLAESFRANVSRETGTMDGVHDDSQDNVSRETVEKSFRDALQESRSQELDRGVTLIGPHRDDLALQLNGLPVKGYASHGESWSFALSLRLALASLLRAESPAGDPVIILDDVFAELDIGRRERLMRAVGNYEQVIVTAAVEGDVPGGEGAEPGGTAVPVSTWNMIRVTAGKVGEADGKA